MKLYAELDCKKETVNYQRHTDTVLCVQVHCTTTTQFFQKKHQITLYF